MKIISIVCSVFVILFLGYFYFFQRNLIYVPDKTQINFAKLPMVQRVKVTTADGLVLQAGYSPAKAHKPTVLFTHGNAGNIEGRGMLAQSLIDQGLGVLLVEYRGYGGNPGSPTEQGLYQDATASYQFLLSQGISANRIVFFGESLGTGVAVELASQYLSCALILQSPYTNLADLARYHYPWAILSPWDKFDSLSKIAHIKTPLLVFHGTEDSIVPYFLGEVLYQAAPAEKEWVSFVGKGHSDLRNEDFYRTFFAFIQQFCHS